MSQTNRPANELQFYGREVLPMDDTDCAPIAEDIIKAHKAMLNALQVVGSNQVSAINPAQGHKCSVCGERWKDDVPHLCTSRCISTY